MRLLAVVAISGVAASSASGQSFTFPDRQEVLVAPEGQPILCMMPSAEDAGEIPPEAVARVFRFGKARTDPVTIWPREIMAVFDSAGGPIMLLDEVVHYGSNDMAFGGDVVVAIFSDGQVVGSISRQSVDTVALKAAVADGDLEKGFASAQPPVRRELSEPEVAQVKLLGEWLWKRHCPKPSAVVSPTREG